MRVVQVCADRGIAPGATKGASQHLRGIAVEMVRMGHHVTTVTARSPEGPFPAEVEPLDALDVCCAGADLVYERYSLGHTDGLDAARRHGARFVLEVNAPLLHEATRHRPDTVRAEHAAAEARLLDEADLVVVVSRPLAEWAARHRRGPIAVVRNGVEPAWFPQAADPANVDTLVFLGHPKPWHGTDAIPRMMVDLAAAGHRPRVLVIGGGPGAAELAELAGRHGVADRLHITGALPPAEATALLQTASIGLAPYPPHEDFYFCPLKVLDYLAAGLAVVATDQGDVAELVGDAGVTVPAGDHAAFTAAVARLLDDADLRATMGAAGRARALSTMTWRDAAAATMQAIERCAEVGAAP